MTIECAYHGHALPAKLPRLRMIGVGPDQEQCINDVPDPERLMQLAAL